jgi:small subunit ribosomal protein S16
MAVKIRLARFGAKKSPFYRLVVADARSPRDGRFVDTIGHYNPKSDPPAYTLDQERAKLWLGRGAQPTMAAARVLFKFGLIEQPWTDTPATPPKDAAKASARAAKAEAAAAAQAAPPVAAATESPAAEPAAAEPEASAAAESAPEPVAAEAPAAEAEAAPADVEPAKAEETESK